MFHKSLISDIHGKMSFSVIIFNMINTIPC